MSFGQIAVTIFAVIVIALIVGVILLVRKDRTRRASFAAEAPALGWRYVEEAPGMLDGYSGEPFQEASHPRVGQVFGGQERGWSFRAFDYTWRRSHGHGADRETHSYHRAIVMVGLPEPQPGMVVSPAHLGAKIAGLFGHGDLQVGRADFDRAFTVEADDGEFARGVLTSATVDWLLSEEGAQDMSWRVDGSQLICWWWGVNNSMEEVRSRVATAGALAERLTGR